MGLDQICAEARRFLREPMRLYIDGQFVDAADGEFRNVENPATEEMVATAAMAGAADVDKAVAAAGRALKGEWATMAPADRGRLIWKLGDLIEEHGEVIADLEILDNGLPRMMAQLGSVKFVADYLRYYAGWATKIEGQTIPMKPLINPDAEALTYTLREPIGVVGAIIPWNHPTAMLGLKLGPALAAGCTLVIKPAELTPMTATYIAKLAHEAGFPPGVINIIPGFGATAGQAMADHDGIDKITFTGSTAVGKNIVHASTGNLKKVTLELGGKSPFIVMPDADLGKAIEGAVPAAFLLSGQNCMAGTRLYLHEDIHDQFLEMFIPIVESLPVGDGFAEGTMIGPLISAQQKARVLDYIEIGKKEGATLACGGESLDRAGHFVSPAVFTGCIADMRIVKEEIFGPVLVVRKFGGDDLADVAAEANSTIYGLSGSVWTENVSTAHRLARMIDSGQVGINTHAAIDPANPFGGNKQSGWGREFGKEGLDGYLKTKSITAVI